MNKIKNLLLTSLLIFSVTVRSEDVISIKKGEPAPFSGLLFTQEKSETIRRELLELDKLLIRNESLSKQLQLSDTRIELKEEQIESYRLQNRRLEKANNLNSNMQYIWFGLGILVTGAAVYGAGALSRD